MLVVLNPGVDPSHTSPHLECLAADVCNDAFLQGLAHDGEQVTDGAPAAVLHNNPQLVPILEAALRGSRVQSRSV